jgi:diguanylate cyclase (GGDEF)-like protein
MRGAARETLERWQDLSRRLLERVEVLTLFPILVLGAQATGRTSLVLAAAMVLPSLLVLQNFGRRARADGVAAMGFTPTSARPADRTTLLAMLDRIACMQGMETACFVLEIDDWPKVERRLGSETARDVLCECDRRLRTSLRGDDLVADLGGATFGIVLHPIAAARLGIRDAIADRMRAGLAAPFRIGDTTLRLTASVGHAALGGAAGRDAEATLAGATHALREAQFAGLGSVRSHVPGGTCRPHAKSHLSEDVPDALASHAIDAWFQPQIDARSGQVTGFEALARWAHPVHGLLTPDRFLKAVEHAGRMEELGASIRQQAMQALNAWDHAGYRGLTVSINAGDTELRSPDFAEHVAWDLDAAGIEPGRLIIEVLESVAADARDDSILATLSALRSQGIPSILTISGWGRPPSCRSAASACAASRSTDPSSSGSTRMRNSKRWSAGSSRLGAAWGWRRWRRASKPRNRRPRCAGWAAASCRASASANPCRSTTPSPGSKPAARWGPHGGRAERRNRRLVTDIGIASRRGFSIPSGPPRRRQNAP